MTSLDCPQYQLVTVEDLSFETKGTLTAVLCRILGPQLVSPDYKPLRLALFPALALSFPLASGLATNSIFFCFLFVKTH